MCLAHWVLAQVPNTLWRNGLTQCPEISGPHNCLWCIDWPGFWGQEEKRQISHSCRSRNHLTIYLFKVVRGKSLLWRKLCHLMAVFIKTFSPPAFQLEEKFYSQSGQSKRQSLAPSATSHHCGSAVMWDDLLVKIPTVLHLDICEKKPRTPFLQKPHLCDTEKRPAESSIEGLLRTPARFSGGDNETWVISLPLPLSSFIFLCCFILFFSASIKNSFAYWFAEYSKKK